MSYQYFLLFSQKDLRSFSHDIYIHTSSDFFHRVFKELFRLITRPQEDQIDYRTTRRRKLIKGECYEEIRINDQFMYYLIRLVVRRLPFTKGSIHEGTIPKGHVPSPSLGLVYKQWSLSIKNSIIPFTLLLTVCMSHFQDFNYTLAVSSASI